jgi:hypothetical protein
MKILQQVLSWVLIVLGCVHNFVAAPMLFEEINSRALWFVSGGLALWYAGFINLLCVASRAAWRLLNWLALVTNATLLAFVATYATAQRIWFSPAAVVLIGTIAALFVCSLLSLRAGPGSTPAHAAAQ